MTDVADQHQTQMMRQPNDPEVVCMRCCPAHVYLPNVPCCLIMLIFLCQDIGITIIQLDIEANGGAEVTRFSQARRTNLTQLNRLVH